MDIQEVTIANPKVTVLMSVYNSERYMREAIEGIFSQTFKDFDFLIINDGSTDSSREIILSYKDPRIRLIDNKKNIGLTRSLNKGLKLARGEYIARQDADDISLPERLEKQINFLDENKDVGIVGSSLIEIDGEADKLYTLILATEDKEIRERLFLGNYFGFEMFRKSVLEKVGYYREEFRYAQDYDLALRIAEVSKIANIREPLYKYRVIPNSISIAKKVMQDKYCELARELAKERSIKGVDKLDYLTKGDIKKILPRLTLKDYLKQRYLTSSFYFRHAIRLLKNGERKISLKYICKSIINNPFGYYQWIFLVENFINRRLIKLLRSAKREAHSAWVYLWPLQK